MIYVFENSFQVVASEWVVQAFQSVIVHLNSSIHPKKYLLRTYDDPRTALRIRSIVASCILQLEKQTSLLLGKLKPGGVYYII